MSVVLATAVPLVDRAHVTLDTHGVCIESGIATLSLERGAEIAAPFRRHKAALIAGSLWTDSGLRNISHFFNPNTRRGLWGRDSASDLFFDYRNRAIREFRIGNLHRAMFWIGATVHLVQDMCEPHHAACSLFNRHREFEREVWSIVTGSGVKTGGGIYSPGADMHAYLVENAVWSTRYWDEARSPRPDRYAIRQLLDRAQATTAGVLEQFARVAA